MRYIEPNVIEECKSIQIYKNEIIEILNKIDNVEYLFKIYHYILAKYRREIANKKGTGN